MHVRRGRTCMEAEAEAAGGTRSQLHLLECWKPRRVTPVAYSRERMAHGLRVTRKV